MKKVFNSVARVEQLAACNNNKCFPPCHRQRDQPIHHCYGQIPRLPAQPGYHHPHLRPPWYAADGFFPGTGLYGSDLQPFSNKTHNTNGRKITPLQMKQYLRCNSNFSYRFAFTTNFQKCCYFSFSSVAFFRSPFYNCLNRIFILFRILMPRKRIETGGVSYREVFSP